MDSRPSSKQRQRASLLLIAGYGALVGIATAFLLVAINILLPASYPAHGAMQSIARGRPSGGGQDLLEFLLVPFKL